MCMCMHIIYTHIIYELRYTPFGFKDFLFFFSFCFFNNSVTPLCGFLFFNIYVLYSVREIYSMIESVF